MACQCPNCSAPIPWIRRGFGFLFWRRWECACGAKLRWQHARPLTWALALLAGGVFITLSADRPDVAAAIVILWYIALLVQNAPELVFPSSSCLRCGQNSGQPVCPECGWVDLQGARN